ncbi:MAG: hypothetical protein ABW098_08225 [Candidatus Thiodiazotropha sp.]
MTNEDGKYKDSIDIQNIPDHLSGSPGLYVRESGRIVAAPEEDLSVARRYPTFADKGPLVGGKRLTLMTSKQTYKVHEQVRVIHVVEVVEPGQYVYVMGPKEVFGEHLDGKLVSASLPTRDDPLVPNTYDGAVLPSPAVDYNYEVTTYVFDEPGTHRIFWQLSALRSNVIQIQIEKLMSSPGLSDAQPSS